jgi:uncharacterized membrane protein YbhN (UPF0104 family)
MTKKSSDKPPASRPRIPWIWTVAWIGVTVLLAVFYRPFDWREVASRLTEVRWGWIGIAVASNFLLLGTLTLLWRLLAPPDAVTARRHMGEIVALSAAGMNTLPFGGGHALAVGLLLKRGALGAEQTATLVAIDQLFEGLAKITVGALAMAVIPLPTWMHQAVVGIGLAVLLALITLVWLIQRPAATTGWLGRWSGHVRFLRRPETWIVGMGWSLGGKGAEALGILAVQHACGVELPWMTAVVVLAVVNVSTIVSITPGNLGVYQAAVFAVYTLLGVPADTAITLGLLQHFAYLVAMIVPAYGLTAWRTYSAS